MRRILTIWLLALAGLLFTGLPLAGQGRSEGVVSYITSQHVYVRFPSTGGLADGDTLFAEGSPGPVPALRILAHSSTSCMCEVLHGQVLQTGDRILGPPVRETAGTMPTENVSVPPDTAHTTLNPEDDPESLEVKEDKRSPDRNRQDIRGRLSVSTYSLLRNAWSEGSQRMRYTFCLQPPRWSRAMARSGISGRKR